MDESEVSLPLCPSFSSYSSQKFAEIAASNDTQSQATLADEPPPLEASTDLQEDNDDSEFEFVRSDYYGLSKDEMLDEFPQIFPVFNRDRLMYDSHDKPDLTTLSRLPLKNLFIEDEEEKRDDSLSSSEEEEELESVPPAICCIWRSIAAEASPSRCKKSNSTGSAPLKSWKFLGLLRRSNSDSNGMDGRTGGIENHKERRNSGDAGGMAGKLKSKRVAGGKKASPLSDEVLYVHKPALKGEEKRKSYLPYRQGIIGRTFLPFYRGLHCDLHSSPFSY